LRGDELWLHGRGQPRLVLRVGQIPIALGGAARFNVANALAAAAVAEILGFSLEEIRSGLRNFQSTPAQNPGRQNRFELGAVHAMVDFAHNPHGVRAALEMAWSLPGERRLIVLGQAGDREELSIREMARLAWDARPDMIVIKELTEHLRGRAPGVIPALIEDELRALGAPEERFVHCESELEAVSWALDWARPGDLLLLFVHDKREEVLALLEERARSGWTPGN
jgi:UDP-N-acetylmuramyl tripeptide synthase